MNKTKIEWCDMTWNPVTGCLHGCEYCYARGIANRFNCGQDQNGCLHVLDDPKIIDNSPGDDLGGGIAKIKDPWGFGFDPTFHKYRLPEPATEKKPQRIFVCSMADLFGSWVPDKWIHSVFEACEKAPWHQYLFLTKNPGRFQDVFLAQKLHISDNMWFGFSVENQKALSRVAMSARYLPRNSFISIEPIHGPIDLTHIEPDDKDVLLDFTTGRQYWLMGGDENGKQLRWVIVGAESGNRKGKVAPQKSWIDYIVRACDENRVPLFMKDSVIPIVGEQAMLRQWPEELRKGQGERG